MRKLPLIPTIVVACAVAAMIALGVWQLQRRHEKESLLALYRANQGRAAMTFPKLAPVPAEAMFRPSSVTCLSVAGWRSEGGRAADGSTGYRHIAECRTGAEGPGALIDMGVAADPKVKPVWNGGTVSGRITTEPDHTTIVGHLFGRGHVLRPMLVADTPAQGLKPSAKPSPDSVPNNHLAYAIQWFFFAAVALLIYVLALRRRGRVEIEGKSREDRGAPPA